MDFYFPYLIDYSHLAVETVAVFCVAALAGIMVSAEGQAFVATLLGDSRVGAKDRFHYNVFLHMSVLGSLNFLVAGFGWAKEMDIDVSKFKKHPRLFLIIARLAGPMANLLLANIAASLNWLIGSFGLVDNVFSMVAAVNVTMAVYGLIMIPPLPGSVLLLAFFPDTPLFNRAKKNLNIIGPITLISIFAAVRLSDWDGISSVFTPVVSVITRTILGL
ncbi:MAG: hypothetical protein OEL83_17410 [Desulforhopalus sp.]|nr:hypothetical protein [Desulforhopalus sp.]